MSESVNRKEVQKLAILPENRHCVDCGFSPVSWCSLNLGVFFCIQCSGIHRQLGVQISQVRSLTLDKFTDEQLAGMKRTTNEEFNSKWEAKLRIPASELISMASNTTQTSGKRTIGSVTQRSTPATPASPANGGYLQGSDKISSSSSDKVRTTYIFNKYQYKKYYSDIIANTPSAQTPVGAGVASQGNVQGASNTFKSPVFNKLQLRPSQNTTTTANSTQNIAASPGPGFISPTPSPQQLQQSTTLDIFDLGGSFGASSPSISTNNSQITTPKGSTGNIIMPSGLQQQGANTPSLQQQFSNNSQQSQQLGNNTPQQAMSAPSTKTLKGLSFQMKRGEQGNNNNNNTNNNNQNVNNNNNQNVNNNNNQNNFNNNHTPIQQKQSEFSKLDLMSQILQNIDTPSSTTVQQPQQFQQQQNFQPSQQQNVQQPQQQQPDPPTKNKFTFKVKSSLEPTNTTTSPQPSITPQLSQSSQGYDVFSSLDNMNLDTNDSAFDFIEGDDQKGDENSLINAQDDEDIFGTLVGGTEEQLVSLDQSLELERLKQEEIERMIETEKKMKLQKEREEELLLQEKNAEIIRQHEEKVREQERIDKFNRSRQSDDDNEDLLSFDSKNGSNENNTNTRIITNNSSLSTTASLNDSIVSGFGAGNGPDNEHCGYTPDLSIDDGLMISLDGTDYGSKNDPLALDLMGSSATESGFNFMEAGDSDGNSNNQNDNDGYNNNNNQNNNNQNNNNNNNDDDNDAGAFSFMDNDDDTTSVTLPQEDSIISPSFETNTNTNNTPINSFETKTTTTTTPITSVQDEVEDESYLYQPNQDDEDPWNGGLFDD